MSDNNLNNNLQQDIDDLLQNLQRTGRERRKQLKQMSKAGMLQYCVDKSSGGAILDQYPTKKGCENAGYKWKDMRPLTEKVEEKMDAVNHALGAPDRHLQKMKEKLQTKMKTQADEHNPCINIAPKSGYISFKYGILRQAALNGDDYIVIPYDVSDGDPLKLPNSRKIFREREDDAGNPYYREVTWTEDANLYFGVTKASLIYTVNGSISSANMTQMHKKGKKLTAAFSMSMKKAKVVGGGSELKLTFYNMPEKNTSIPSDDFSRYVPVDLTDDSFDDDLIYAGRYIDPDAASADVGSAMMEAWKAGMNNMQQEGNQMLVDSLTLAQEEIFSREFFCCVYFELVSGIPHLSDYLGENLGLDPNHLEKVYIWHLERKIANSNDQEQIAKWEAEIEEWKAKDYSIEQFLIDMKEDIAEIKKWIEIVIGLYTNQSLGFGFPSLMFNIIETLTQSVYTCLMFLIEELQLEVTTEVYDWIEERQAELKEWTKEELEKNGYCSDDDFSSSRTVCIEAGGEWTYSGNFKTAMMQCLPWEQLVVLLVEILTGEQGLFDQLRGMVQRLRAAMLLRARNRGLPAYQFAAEAQKDNILKWLTGMLDMCNWLLALNIDALQVCGAYSRDLSMLDPDNYTDSVNDVLGGTTTPDGSGYSTGADANNIPNMGANMPSTTINTGDSNLNIHSQQPTEQSSTTKIDITGNIVDPIGLLVYRSDADIAKFFNQYLGLSKEQAEESLTNAQRGQCFSRMSDEEARQIKEILNNAGVDI